VPYFRQPDLRGWACRSLKSAHIFAISGSIRVLAARAATLPYSLDGLPPTFLPLRLVPAGHYLTAFGHGGLGQAACGLPTACRSVIVACSHCQLMLTVLKFRSELNNPPGIGLYCIPRPGPGFTSSNNLYCPEYTC
jgi:hypothetical protein